MRTVCQAQKNPIAKSQIGLPTTLLAIYLKWLQAGRPKSPRELSVFYAQKHFASINCLIMSILNIKFNGA